MVDKGTDSVGELADSPSEASGASSRRGTIFLIVAVLLIIGIILGGLWYRQWSAQRAIEADRYNGFTFTQVSNGKILVWLTQVQVGGSHYDIPFYTHPRESEDVVFERGVASRFIDPATRPSLIYMTFGEHDDTSVVVGAVEVSRLLGRQYDIFNIETHSAFKSVTSNTSSWPIVTCKDATRATAVLSFDPSMRNMVRRDETNPYCIRIEYATANDSIRVSDRFAYALLQIMPG